MFNKRSSFKRTCLAQFVKDCKFPAFGALIGFNPPLLIPAGLEFCTMDRGFRRKEPNP
jgi:hypothetical protein